MSRTANITRKTRETDIRLTVNLDGEGRAEVVTGVGFFDHMLTHLAKHSGWDLTVEAKGDLEVDSHHTVEDIGICLGSALKNALGDKAGIERFADAAVPMDETLVQAAVDISGRSHLEYAASYPSPKIGEFDVELVEEFLRAMVNNAGVTLHVAVIRGGNSHHVAEAIFKATARALGRATRRDPARGQVPSTKGTL
ncbi:MAG: imidazoleglycerol-phosphate dehydratase HisB [Phycisphaerae bacterium]|nr:imidazoleglycerol-phosphate dehydratase HisB [Phycisphaerae bacterium]